MERLAPEILLEESSSTAEHTHRYQFLASFMSGEVLDVACGLGYGSEILHSQAAITHYTGVDNELEAINWAQANLLNEESRFLHASILDLPLEENRFDTVCTLETLEHLKTPSQAIKELRRVLKPDGILCGSVPTKDFEDLCTSAYGPNVYHLQAFELETLSELLKTEFESVEIFLSSFELGTRIRHLSSSDGNQANLTTLANTQELMGSFVFLAGPKDTVKTLVTSNDYQSNYSYTSFVNHEKNTTVKLHSYIKELELALDAKSEYIKSTESQVIERDNYIKKTESQIIKRDGYIKDLETKLSKKS